MGQWVGVAVMGAQGGGCKVGGVAVGVWQWVFRCVGVTACGVAAV